MPTTTSTTRARKNVIRPIKIPEYMILQANNKLGDLIKTVEKHKTTDLYRLTFFNEEAPAFIQKVENSGKEYHVFFHYCENNENGYACSHLAPGIAVGDRIGINVTHGLSKSTHSFINMMNKYEDEEYEILNGGPGFKDFITIVDVTEDPEDTEEIEETEEAESEQPIVTPKTTSSKRDWKKDWYEIQDYLIDSGATHRLIMEVQEKRERVCATVSLTESTSEPTKPQTPYIGSIILRAIKHILNGKDLILIGDKGAGKDTLINTIAWVFGYPITLISGNGDEDKESLVTEPAFKNNESTHVLSEFMRSVQNGDLVNFAEINMLHGDVTSVFHSLLDDNRAITTKVGVIKRHPEHLIIGSMNVGEGYTGIKVLNEAFKDRFAILRLPYGDFLQIIKAKSGLEDDSALDFLVKIKEAIDRLVVSNGGEGAAAKTIRGYIDAAKYLNKYGFNHKTKVEAIEDNIVNKVTNFEEMIAVRQAIREYAWPDFPMSHEEEIYINAGGDV